MEVVALLAFLVFVVWLGWLLRKADGDAPGFPGRRLVRGSSQPRSRSGPARRCSRRCGARTTDSPTSWRQPLDTNGAAFGLTWALDALMLAAAGGVIMMTRCAPRWLGWSALAIAVLSMVAVRLRRLHSGSCSHCSGSWWPARSPGAARPSRPRCPVRRQPDPVPLSGDRGASRRLRWL